jgi:hypothetical protein
MLADFPVAVSLNGERYIVICRDVTTASFFYEYPEVAAGTTELDQRTDYMNTRRWIFGLVTRVLVDPILSIDAVNSLDEGALDAGVAYCHAVGYFTDELLAIHADLGGELGAAVRRYQQSLGALSDKILPAPSATPPLFRHEHMPYIRQAAPGVRAKIRAIADRTHTRPSAIWLSPISETMIDYHILIDGDDTTANELTGEDARIGFVN